MTRTCHACGHVFTPRPQVPNQNYCPRPECQRTRRRFWQQKKRHGDSDYRDNDIRACKVWASENADYWRRYRDENPVYAERNRNLQQQRNQKRRGTVIANEDVSEPLTRLPLGRYRVTQIRSDTESDCQTWIVEITALAVSRPDEDA